jgi:hypothetical protein
VTDQEILNRIDAEIEKALKRISYISASSASSDVTASMEATCDSYINGLKFTRALIQKRMEEVAF